MSYVRVGTRKFDSRP